MAKDPNCVFCKIVSGEIPSTKVVGGPDFLAILDIHPITPGHTVVFSVNHFSQVSQMSDEEKGRLFNQAVKVGEGMVERGEAEGYNILLCSNEAAQSGVAHRPHLHVIPRKVGDNLKIDPRA